LSGFSAVQLGALAVREAVRRAGVAPEQIDECIMAMLSPPDWDRTGTPGGIGRRAASQRQRNDDQ